MLASTSYAQQDARAESQAQGPLFLVGGGKRDAAALRVFMGWSVEFALSSAERVERSVRVLIVPWASSEGGEACAAARADFLAAAESMEIPAGISLLVECSPAALQSEASIAEAKKGFESADGIFFGGGDQVRLLETLDSAKLTNLVRSRNRKGLPVGGTSAGLAVLSEVMLTGEGDFTVIDPDSVETRKGLDLAHGAIFDQHFLKRQRLNRLLSALQGNSKMVGVGVDEDVAAGLTPDGKLTVLSEGIVTVVRPIALDPRRFNLRLLSKGDWIKL